jgi:hypothetical protein
MSLLATPERTGATSLGAALVGLMYGAVAGAVLTSIVFVAVFVVALVLTPGDAGWGETVAPTLVAALIALPFSAIVWGAGLLVIGAPSWALLHALGFRSRRAGAGCGALLTGLTAWGLPMLLFQARPVQTPPPFILTWAIIGAAVGWVTVKVAQDSQGETR